MSIFVFKATAPTAIYTLSLHGRSSDLYSNSCSLELESTWHPAFTADRNPRRDRKSTRLNSSHANISYAVFCLKKKNHQLTYLSKTDALDGAKCLMRV